MKANDRQVGGSHYRGNYQHWDWSQDIDLRGLAYAATKYIVRYKKKDGRQGLEKALHYIEKMREDGATNPYLSSGAWGTPADDIDDLTIKLSIDQILDSTQHSLLLSIAKAKGPEDLVPVIDKLESMLADMPHDTEEAAMRHHSRKASASPIDHPAPFGYDGEG